MCLKSTFLAVQKSSAFGLGHFSQPRMDSSSGFILYMTPIYSEHLPHVSTAPDASHILSGVAFTSDDRLYPAGRSVLRRIKDATYITQSTVSPVSVEQPTVVTLTHTDNSVELGVFQQTGYTDPMLVQCWASVADDGPTLNQHWVSVSC